MPFERTQPLRDDALMAELLQFYQHVRKETSKRIIICDSTDIPSPSWLRIQEQFESLHEDFITPLEAEAYFALHARDLLAW